eukprot:UC4_evm2s553
MSYNNIGLASVRGSGTNGYVQRNVSNLTHHRQRKASYRSEEDQRRMARSLNRKPNKDILEHNRKREVELKCVEMEEQMEEQGYPEEEIEERIAKYREDLLKKSAAMTADKNSRETHAMAAANVKKNQKLMSAFGISKDYESGSAFDPEAQERRKQERMAQREAERTKREEERRLRIEEKDREENVRRKFRENEGKEDKEIEMRKEKLPVFLKDAEFTDLKKNHGRVTLTASDKNAAPDLES